MITLSSSRKRRGFTLVELAIVLAVSGTMFAGLWRLMSSGGAQLRDQSVAGQQQQVISGVKSYLQSSVGQSWIMTNTTAGGNFTLNLPNSTTGCASTPCLFGYVPTGLTTTSVNAYGQSYAIVLNIAAHAAGAMPNYSFVVVTSGGDAIPDTSGGRLASLIGGDGGFVYANTDVCTAITGSTRVNSACGSYGAWATTLSTYGGVAATTGGHIASRTFMSADEGATSPWLARSLLNGDPTYNTMSTSLYMSSVATGSHVVLGNNQLFTGTSTALAAASTGGINLQGGCLSGTNTCVGLGTTAGGRINDMGYATIGSSTTTGSVLILNSKTGTGNTTLQANGDAIVTGTLTANTLKAGSFLYTTTSDLRLKKNIEELQDPLKKLMSLSAISYELKSSGQKGLGVIAQQVKEAYPELVHSIGKGFWGVDYNGLIGPVIGAIKQLATDDVALQTKIKQQDEKIQELEKKLDQIQKKLDE